MEFVSADRFIDRVYGKVGTPERDAVEASICEELKAIELGEAIKKTRISKNMTQQELSKIAGVNQSQISMAERGMNVTISTLSRLLRAMGLQARLYVPTVGDFVM